MKLLKFPIEDQFLEKLTALMNEAAEWEAEDSADVAVLAIFGNLMQARSVYIEYFGELEEEIPIKRDSNEKGTQDV